MRSDLTKIEGVDSDSIKTDHKARKASFIVKKDVDYKAKLASAAETNEHLENYEIVN